MENEQTDKTDTEGKETDKPVEVPNNTSKLLNDAAALVTRQEAANKDTKEILKRQEFLKANEMLGGTGGGRVETQELSAEQAKKEGAKEFFKGTQLEKDIDKT